MVPLPPHRCPVGPLPPFSGDLPGAIPCKTLAFPWGVLFGALLVYSSRVDGSGEVAFNSAQKISSSYAAFAAIAADLDLDGDFDIVVGHTYGNAVIAYANDGTGVFTAGSDMSVAPYYRPR